MFLSWSLRLYSAVILDLSIAYMPWLVIGSYWATNSNAVMEKRCGFCMELSPIVYCKADAAYLCLSCDAKVHSANALSFRHPRTLLCESCRCGPAIVRCCDHRMFMCQSCDDTIHHLQQHKKMVITCYVGCPSAEDLASLWGFDFNHLTATESEGTKVACIFLINWFNQILD